MKITDIFSAKTSVIIVCFIGISSADIITQQFNIEVDFSDLPSTSVGEIYTGSITYDNEYIPVTGTYHIGHLDNYHDSYHPENEYQNWRMIINSPFLGKPDRENHFETINATVWPVLQFENGTLSGIAYTNHLDFLEFQEERFYGKEYFAWGGYYDNMGSFQPASVHGILSFQVPEPSTMTFTLISMIGIIGIGLIRKLV